MEIMRWYVFGCALSGMILRWDDIGKREDEIFLDEGFGVHLIGWDDGPK